MTARRILITGASGMVGSWIIRLARRHNWEVHGLVRSGPPHARLSALAGEVILHRADVREAEALHAVLHQVQPTAVLHAAFTAAHRLTPSTRREMCETGITGTANLLEAIRATASVTHTAFVGSSTAYGPAEHAHAPTDSLWPQTFRGACKAAGSLLCHQFAAETGRRCTEVRLFSVYGPWEQPERLLPKLLRAALRGETISLTVEPRLRNWIYAEDAAEACLAALDLAADAAPVFNACAAETVSTHDLARLHEEIVDRKLIGEFDPQITDAYGDANPRGVLSGPADGVPWRPKTKLAEGLRLSWAWAQTPAGRRHLGVEP